MELVITQSETKDTVIARLKVLDGIIPQLKNLWYPKHRKVEDAETGPDYELALKMMTDERKFYRYIEAAQKEKESLMIKLAILTDTPKAETPQQA